MSKLSLICLLASSMLAASALVAPAHAQGGVIVFEGPCLDAAAKARIATLKMQIDHEQHMLDAERTALANYQAKLPVAEQRVADDKALIAGGADSWPANFNPQLDLNAATQAVNNLVLDIQLSEEHITRLEANILADNQELIALSHLPPCPEPVPQTGLLTPPVQPGHLVINVPFGDDDDLPRLPRIDKRDSWRTETPPLMTPPNSTPVRNEKSVIDVFKTPAVHSELKTEPNVRPGLVVPQTKPVEPKSDPKTVTLPGPHTAPQVTTIAHGQNQVHTNAFARVEPQTTLRTNAISRVTTPSLPMHLAHPAPVLGHAAPQAVPAMHMNVFHPAVAPTMPRLGGFNMARMGGIGRISRDAGPTETTEGPREPSN